MRMLILIPLISFALFLISQKKPNIKSIQYVIMGLFVLFVVEFFAYGYLIYAANRGGNFALIGNQMILDKIIKMRFIEQAYFKKRSSWNIYQIDNKLGYSLGENKYMGKYKATNSQGIRADREYTLIPEKDVLRLAAFGDSYVFCDGEVTQNTWTYFLENSVKNLEVLNFGVSGYGFGQSYLRYLKDGLKFNPDVVLFNYILTGQRDIFSAADIIKGRDLVNPDVYRVRFWLEQGALKSMSMTPLDLFSASFRETFIYKPFGISEKQMAWSNKIFSLSNIGLLIKQSALQKMFLRHALKSQDPDIVINLKILDNLLMTAEENKTTVIFLYDAEFNTLPPPIQQLLMRYSKRVAYIKLTDLLKARHLRHGVKHKDLLNKTGHFNARGNKIYAETIAGILMSRTWGEGDRVFKFDAKLGSFVNAGKK